MSTELLERPQLATSPDLDDCNGDFFEAYAVLTTPQQVVIEGTTRHIQVMRCSAGHVHLGEPVVWGGPLAPIGFAEVWERSGGGELVIRIPSPVNTLPEDDAIQLGPGILGMAS